MFPTHISTSNSTSFILFSNCITSFVVRSPTRLVIVFLCVVIDYTLSIWICHLLNVFSCFEKCVDPSSLSHLQPCCTISMLLLNYFILTVRDTRNSTSANLLTLPYASLDIFKNSFAYRGPFIWNDIPHDISKCATLSCFKTALKAHILNVWYVITTMFTHFSKIQLYIVIFRCLCQFYWHFIYFIIDCTVYVIYTLTCCM